MCPEFFIQRYCRLTIVPPILYDVFSTVVSDYFTYCIFTMTDLKYNGSLSTKLIITRQNSSLSCNYAACKSQKEE